jgi:hypothetical protein
MTREKGPIAAGFESLSHGKLILLLALVTAALGVTGAAPLFPIFQQTMGGTLAGDHFIRNHPTFAPTDFFDLMKEKGAAFDATHRTALFAGLAAILFQTLLAGGIVAVLGRGPFGFGQLFEPARRNFWHNVKCLFLFGLAAAVCLGAWLGGGAAARKYLLEEVPPDAAVRRLTFWILALGAVLIFAALSLLYDFARAARRYSPGIGAWRAYGFARRALSGAWRRALGLWIFWLVLGGAAVVGLFAVTWEMPAVSPPAIALLFVLQFGVLWVRSAARVAAWGSYIGFLDPRARAAVSAGARVRVTFAPAPPAPSPAP